MLLFKRKIQLPRIDKIIITLCSVLLLFLTPVAYAQEDDLFGSAEDDSLLFGEEFDLGGDDFSFDFDEGTEAEETDAGGDDFFGESEDEADPATDDTDDTDAEDEWGMESDADYESLITRTIDGENDLLSEVTDHPLDFRRFVKGTFLEGTGFTFAIFSPQYVEEDLTTWYSYMDYSFTTELPWHVTGSAAELSFLLDISSFNFDNLYPSGGNFKGVAVMPIMRVETFGIALDLGLGSFTPTFGAIVGLGYSYQFHSIYFSGGYRWNWAYEINPIGSSWWLEPRFTAGIRLW